MIVSVICIYLDICIHHYTNITVYMHIWRPFVLWFGARTPAFSDQKKRSFGFHGLQGYVYHTLTKLHSTNMKNVDSYPMIQTVQSFKGTYFHSEIFVVIQLMIWAYPSVARTLHPLRRSPERYSPLWKGRAYKTEWVGLPKDDGFNTTILERFLHILCVSIMVCHWKVIKSTVFFAKSSHSWYRCKTLEKTFWTLSTWNESLVRKNMCQTKWLLLVSTKFNQWLGS